MMACKQTGRLDDTGNDELEALKMKALRCISVDEPFAATPWALPQTKRGAVAVENPTGFGPPCRAPGLVSLGKVEVAPSSSLPPHLATATAGGRTDRDREGNPAVGTTGYLGR